MRKASTPYLYLKDEVYWFRRVVPKNRRADFEGRREWVKCLKTSILHEALVMVAELTEKTTNLLKDVVAYVGQSVQALKERANTLGLKYRHVDVVAAADIEDAVAMVGPGLELIGDLANPDPQLVATIGGTAEPPAMTMRQALEQFETDSSDMWLNLSYRERQKKWNKYKEAVTDFEKTMDAANLDILKLTKKEVYAYRAKLLERVSAKTIKVDTVRKKLMWLRVIVRHAYELEGIKESPFENLRPIKGIGDEEKRRVITEPETVAIRKRYEEVESNDELIAIMAVIENTGAHAKEIVMLTADDIRLDDPIPHICLQPNEHRSLLKTDARIRKVPVLGIALDALKRFPAGFPRYRRDNGGDNLSAAANKHIKAVTGDATTYGYRHRMANLMKAGYVVDGVHKHIEDSIRVSIMGWTGEGMQNYYGDEVPLAVKLDILTKILPKTAY